MMKASVMRLRRRPGLCLVCGTEIPRYGGEIFCGQACITTYREAVLDEADAGFRERWVGLGRGHVES